MNLIGFGVCDLGEPIRSSASNYRSNYRITSSYKATSPSAEEIGTLFTKLGNRKTEAVALSLIPAYADQFVAKSRAVPVVTDLFNTENLDMNFSELLKLCLNVNLDISDERIKQVENYLIFTADIHSQYSQPVNLFGLTFQNWSNVKFE